MLPRSLKKALLLLFTSIPILSLVSNTSAHVGYVLTEKEFTSEAGVDWNFLIEPLYNPFYLFLMAATVAIVALIYYASVHLKPILRELTFINKEADSYKNLVGWMLRLSLGIALIGAGTSGMLLSPAMETSSLIAFMEILIGFLLLTGLFVAPATYAIIPLYLFAFINNPYMFGNLDLFGAALGLLIVADPHPGIDDLVGIPFISPLKKLKPYASFVLRVCLGSAMMYLAIWEKILNPHTSALVADMYHLDAAIPVSVAMWVFAAGVIEFLVGLAIILGFRTRVTAAVAVAVLSLSFFYFKEDVYSHITLFGVLSVIFVLGGGKLSLDQIIDPYFHLKISKQSKKNYVKKKSK